MNITVIGGSGTLGSAVAAEASSRGHSVRTPSRSSTAHPVDLRTGAGLPAALAGTDAVVDASNAMKDARTTLVEGTRRLLEAGRDAGVQHHVGVSIVGCARVPWSYYSVKAEQEAVVRAAGGRADVVRATQFHELVDSWFGAASRYGVRLAAGLLLQPVSVIEVAHVVVDVIEAGPGGGVVDVAGPHAATLTALGRARAQTLGTHRVPVRLPLPGRVGRTLREGALTDPAPDVRGTTSWEQWLGERAVREAAARGSVR